MRGAFVCALLVFVPSDVLVTAFIGLALTLVLDGFFGRSARRANNSGLSDPIVIARPWVIDGDTIDDKATGIRYRLANIDAPETGDNAKCFREREQGEVAKWAAIRAVRAGVQVTVRDTFRIDRYGRHIAFVYIDGKDMGDWLVAEGLACSWYGRRRRWCGAHGQLREMAAVRGVTFSCKTCARW